MKAPLFRSPHRTLPVSASLSGMLGLLLAGCASTQGLSPEGQLLAHDQLQVTRSVAGVPLSSAAFPQRDWWTSLGDPKLAALIDEALAGTPGLDAADARVRLAIAQAGLADVARKPSLAATAQYAGVLVPETIAPEPIGGEYQGIVLLGLNFKYSPDLWGGHRARWQAAVGQARAAEVDAQAARLMLSSNIAQAYVALALAHDASDIATQEQQRSRLLSDLGEQRFNAGLDNQLQLRQAQSAVASADQQVQAAQQRIDAARNALAALLGKGPDRGRQIDRPALLTAPTPQLPAELPSQLLGHRPDVVAARWRVEASARGIAASKADFYPSVNLAALVGVAAGNLSDLFGSDALLVQGGPALSLPIFDGGRLRNQLAKSNADYDLAVATYNQTLIAALREVADAVQAARSLDAQIASATQARDAAQAAWDIATRRYRGGVGTQLDVLNAQRPLLQFDQQLAALRAQRYTVAIDLDRAFGGGLAFAGPDFNAHMDAPTDTDSDLAKVRTP